MVRTSTGKAENSKPRNRANTPKTPDASETEVAKPVMPTTKEAPAPGVWHSGQANDPSLKS